jgi:hypothetical protein
LSDHMRRWRTRQLRPEVGIGAYKPVEKHGSEAADRSVMTSAGNGSDLD